MSSGRLFVIPSYGEISRSAVTSFPVVADCLYNADSGLLHRPGSKLIRYQRSSKNLAESIFVNGYEIFPVT
jgi:hypothetical protein